MKKLLYLFSFIFVNASLFAQYNPEVSKYSIGNHCSLTIPGTLELRDASSATGKIMDQGVAHFMLEFDAELPSQRIVFQPKGMNSSDKKTFLAASEKYARVIVEIFPGGGLSQSDIDALSELDMRELSNAYQEQYTNDMYKMKYDISDFKWFPLKRVKYSGKNSLVIHYLRGGLKGQVDVTEYLFVHRGKQIRIIASYRLSEKNIWAIDFEKILSTIKFK